jgi:SAM-dependent methyltransferase
MTTLQDVEAGFPSDTKSTRHLAQLEAALPLEFDEDIYRELHRDLKQMTSEQLRSHWRHHGQREGRRSNALTNRTDFVRLIPSELDALEIGPFHDPLLQGPRVAYFDILERPALIARAQQIGYPTDRVPEIDFVAPDGDLSIIDQKFDVVLSSHVIEHQPDLIRHVRAVERLLRPGGMYFLLVPDKNYCFDHYMPESTIAEIVNAHHNGRRVHTLRSQIEHAALKTHNSPKRHWQGDHGVLSGVKERILKAIAAYDKTPETYVDVHAWYFTPARFRESFTLLRELSYTSLELCRVYPTLNEANEFWAVLMAPRR